MTPVRYIGVKARQTDTQGLTSTIWNGPNDVQPYPDDKVHLLLRHPTVWELAQEPKVEEPPAPPPVLDAGELYFEHFTDGEGSLYRLRVIQTGDIVDLSLFDDEQLKEFARLNRITADLRKKGDTLRAQIVAAVKVAHEQQPKD